MGSTITIIGFAIWPDLPRTQSLNHAIKNLPMVYHFQTPILTFCFPNITLLNSFLNSYIVLLHTYTFDWPSLSRSLSKIHVGSYCMCMCINGTSL